eukprot:TRINITY_DN2117_c0_g1_i3.p1 TRINITY_DN2117_c0_g1~~TRINITY_DN2117_c0_g1_i3.p1  ORF type:complete len:376 (+),score=70.01 TRINITY_DN2117_c0_g1_i3:72-1199(+)
MDLHVHELLSRLELPVALKLATKVRRILENIKKHPGDAKYRSMSKTAFNNQTDNCGAGVGLIKFLGFEEAGDRLLFTDTLSGLHQSYELIDAAVLTLMEKHRQVTERNLANNHTAMMKAESNRMALLDSKKALNDLLLHPDTDTVGNVSNLKTLPTDVLVNLDKLLRNIAENPSSEKYRTLKKSNAMIATILSCPHAATHLQQAGFTDSSDNSLVCNSEPHHLASCIKALDAAVSQQAADEELAFEKQAEEMKALRKKKPKVDPSDQPLGALDPSVQEELTTAMQLINDIQGYMEQEYLLRGAIGFDATFRKEGMKILEQFKVHRSFKILHELRDNWAHKIEVTKRETKRSMVNTIYCPPDPETGKPHPASFINN